MGSTGAGAGALALAKSSSTSARCGAAKAPPKRVHFSAAAAEANRSACRSSCPSVMASAKAPWNTSPAPSVSTVWTGKAGVSCSSPVLVEPDRALGAAGARQERRRQFGDLLQRLAVVGDPGGLLQRLRWRTPDATTRSAGPRAATSRGRRRRSRECRAGAPRRRDRCRIPRSGSRSGWRRNPPAACRRRAAAPSTVPDRGR